MTIERDMPYVGVTGVGNVEETLKVSNQFKSSKLRRINYQGMVGFLTSDKIFLNRTYHTHTHPSLDMIPELVQLAGDNGSFPSVHYFSYEPDKLGERLNVVIEKVIDRIGDSKKFGLQLNVAWPNPEILNSIKENYPSVRTILQLGPQIMESQNLEADLNRRLGDYAYDTNFVLIDPSGGRGIEIDKSLLSVAYLVVQEKIQAARIIIAGGINARNVSEKVSEAKEVITGEDFGIDAQKGLISKKGDMKFIDTSLTNNYIYKSAAALGR